MPDGERVQIFVAKENIKYVGDGPSMFEGKGVHGCGIFHSKQHSDRPVLVVTGGGGSQYTEYWDFTATGSEWQRSSKKYKALE